MNSGERYGRLTTTRRAGSYKGRNALWECSCSCGGTALGSLRQVEGRPRPVLRVLAARVQVGRDACGLPAIGTG
jgi:hypothetical protein